MVKRLLFILLYICTTAAYGQEFSVYSEGLINSIKPDGWLKEFLVRQKTGMTGHPEAIAYPYNTCLWNGDIPRNRDYGQDWWRYEQTAYYTDGLLRLGYLLNDQELIQKGESGITYTMEHAQQNGRLGNPVISSLWPMVVFARAMMADYQYSKDEKIINALEKHYLSLNEKDLTVGRRHILNLEGMLWVYGHTHNPKLLELARKAYAIGGFEMDAKAAGSDDYIHLHGVTYAEMLKVPLLLYAYTGDKEYLRLALNAERKLTRDHMLPDGVYTSAEFTEGKDIDIAHETCDITDYTWSLGYYLTVTGEAEWADKIEKAIFNAGLGSVTKDFKSLQYFSSVNQFIATGNSDLNNFKKGSTWMAYRPTHETECCAGNVNRFMPNYVSRMWLQGKDDAIVAALYGPSSIRFQCNGSTCEIQEKTNYPFNEDIIFEFKLSRDTEIPFVFRTPNWCKNAQVRLNGRPVKDISLTPGTFSMLKGVFRNGDRLTLHFDMPVELCDVPDQGVYFMRGPLLYSYAIPSNKVEDKTVYENMNGKVSGNLDFKCWSITPAAPFGYAVKLDQDPASGTKSIKLKGKVTRMQEGAYPFDLEHAPVKITLPVHAIKWDLQENRYNPELPALDSLEFTGKKGSIELVPYGCTELRLTVFPWFK